MPAAVAPVLSTISGYEVLVVALATLALVAVVASALVGMVTRLVRGRVEDDRSSRRRSPGRGRPDA